MSQSQYRPYPEYKESGVDWLGSIPAHWSVEPFKRQIERNDGGVWGSDPDGRNDTIVLRSTEQTVDGRWQLDDPAPRKLTKAEVDGALLAEGDLLLTKSSGSSLHIGKTTLVTPEVAALRCCYSNFMQRIRTKVSFLPKLAWYVLNNELARRQLDLLSNSTTGLANLNATIVGQILVICPPLPEQIQIAKFLDHETAKIDRLIEKQEALIRLLKEKRQAVISHAVTKGLNPHAPLKDSGIEWLGQVPAHWTVNRVKYNASLAGRIGFRGYTTEDLVDEGDGAITLSPSNFDGGNLKFEKKTYISWRKYDESPEIKLAIDDIVMVKTGSTLGKIGFVDRVDEPMTINPQIVIFKEVKLRSRFLFHYLASPLIQSLVKVSNTGGTMPTMTQECIGNYPLLIPPVDEQDEIIAALSERCRKFDGLIEHTEGALCLLQERRTALISAAVTGKIDVRHWQPLARQIRLSQLQDSGAL